MDKTQALKTTNQTKADIMRNDELTQLNLNSVIWINSGILNNTAISQNTIQNLHEANIQGTKQTVHTNIDVILPYTQKEMAINCIKILCSRAGVHIRIIAIHDDAQLGFIAISNLVFQQSTADFIAYVAQDAFPGRYWMKIAIDTLNNTNKSLLAFNDGKWFGQLAAFGLVRKNWAEQVYPNNQLFFDGYHSHYADTELSIIAASQNTLAYNPNAILVEVDFEKDKKPTNAKDKKQYAERAKNGFNQLVSDSALISRFR